ncbi:MAG: hypothetical protein IPG59_02695 [Candidatus Melainabacteria bacterium]|nr:MAG: hypothetical protein IPG59_02695 [Candidatus Melainabacteria bacterium]
MNSKKALSLLLSLATCIGLTSLSTSCAAFAVEESTFQSENTKHPLDALTKDELTSAVSIMKSGAKLTKSDSLVFLGNIEPDKAFILSYKSGNPYQRMARAIVYNLDSNQTHEIDIDLTDKKIIADKLRKDVQPMQLEEDIFIGIDILMANSNWKKGLERRGLKDMTDVHMEMFVVGNPVNIDNPKKERLIRAYPYRRVRGANSFGEPIEGLSALINLTTKTAQVQDAKEIIPFAGDSSNYFDPQKVGKLREPCKPLVTTMPEGSSFQIKGSEINWQKWRFRYELDSREGLVLHTLAYEDDNKLRSIMHRAGVSEVSVPYGAPGYDWVWRSPIDEGEYGLGRLTTSLRPGHEVPAHATILDIPYANSVGDVKMKKGAVAIWEQDGGILWEHADDDAGRTSTRRKRQLVIAHMFTLGNYDYFTQWLFNQDGSIDVKVTLNGDVLTQGVTSETCQVCEQEPNEEGITIPKGAERYGTLVAPRVVGINHQHFFCFRLDFDIDGTKNSLYELNVRPISEGRGFLEQNTFVLERTLLKREQEARRGLNEHSNRCWKIVNPNANRYIGHLPGYVIEPGANAHPYSHPESYNRKRASFLDHHFWATKYDKNEMWASGDYPASSPGGEGLSAWSDHTPIENEDLVLWYTVGITHTPRVEDWPVMPAATMGFTIKPEGFFKRNPALDVPEAVVK